MRLLTLLGTRPEIIRLSAIIKRLDACSEQILVHTGQNADPSLCDVFFEQLGVRRPDVSFGVSAGCFADQASQIIARAGAAFDRLAPDRVLILGDTNSGLAAIAAARAQIPVYHLEAGNRCYDTSVPEEVNRRLIDHCSTVLMPYTHRSKENLLREGIERRRIFVVGNPIFEVLNAHRAEIEASNVLARLGVSPQGYFLATIHRAENVDDHARLLSLVDGLDRVAQAYGQPVVVSVHPRTADRLAHHGAAPSSPLVRLMPPMAFFEFVKLERQARAVLSDSGTVQEECCIFRVPSVTLRDTTERPETVEAGSTVLAGVEGERILAAVRLVLSEPPCWVPPPEYLEEHVSTAVAKIVAGI